MVDKVRQAEDLPSSHFAPGPSPACLGDNAGLDMSLRPAKVYSEDYARYTYRETVGGVLAGTSRMRGLLFGA